MPGQSDLWAVELPKADTLYLQQFSTESIPISIFNAR